MSNVENQLNRMKTLMKYGLNEGKNSSYNSVEYSKVAADGKLYGIIREGTKYYIKVSPTTKSQLVENFDYIGGFANRKRNEFSSFANAQKQFDLKMMSINEASRNKINIDSWNPDAKEFLTVEATNKMKKEIQRERQIMKNASLIMEKKGVSECGVAECGNGFSECSGEGCKTTKVDKAAKDTQKTNIKDEGHPFGKPDKWSKKSGWGKKPSKKSLSVNEDVLGWNDDEDYLDTTHGTHVGKDDPFTIDDPDSNQKESMVEGVSMHDEDDQNTPTPGTNKNGKNIKWVKESIEDIEDGEDVDEGDVDTEYELEADNDIEGLDDDVEGLGADTEEMDADTEEMDADVEGLEDDVEDVEDEEEEYDDSLNSRLDALEDKINDILAAVGGDADYADYDTYEDDDLYDDEDLGDEDFDDDEEEEVYESRSYRNMMLKEGGMKRFSDKGRVPSGNMNPLNMFGKHPAYQKKVMTLPSHEHEEFDGYYDMNDDSVRNNKPYGEYIGSSAPFEVEPESIVNAIAESINRNLKKKAQGIKSSKKTISNG